VHYADGARSGNILARRGMFRGDRVDGAARGGNQAGNSHVLTSRPAPGGERNRACAPGRRREDSAVAGARGPAARKEGGYAQLRMPSGESPAGRRDPAGPTVGAGGQLSQGNIQAGKTPQTGGRAAVPRCAAWP